VYSVIKEHCGMCSWLIRIIPDISITIMQMILLKYISNSQQTSKLKTRIGLHGGNVFKSTAIQTLCIFKTTKIHLNVNKIKFKTSQSLRRVVD